MSRPLSAPGAALAFLAIVASSAAAVTIRVPADQPTIATGLLAAQPGDIVELACGTYYEHDLRLGAGVTVRGETGDPTCVIVDGQRLGPVFICDVIEQATIQGLTVTHGRSFEGGGVKLIYSNAMLRDLRIIDNVGIASGGGAFVLGGTVFCERVLLARNTIEYWGLPGPGMMMSHANVHFMNCSAYQGGLTGTNLSVIKFDYSIGWVNVSYGASVTYNCWSADDAGYCNPAADDYRLTSTSLCLPGRTCTWLIGAYGHGCGPVTTNPYTFTTNATNLPLVVDGVTYTPPATFTWTQYTEHTLEVPKTLSVGAGSQWTFKNWNDGGERVRRVHATYSPYTWTAAYDLQHYLAITATSGGTVTPMSNWLNAGSSVTLSATANRGSFFERWDGSGSGSYSGTANPVAITMNGPITQTARFAPVAYEFSISASDVDPRVNRAAPAGGVRSLYLWLICSRGGLAAFEADVTGTLPVYAFEPLSGCLSVGTPTHLLLAVPGCPSGDAVAFCMGRWLVDDTGAGGTLCIGGGQGGSGVTLGAVDCGTLDPFCARFPGVTGFSSGSAAPCRRTGQNCSGAGSNEAVTDAPTPVVAAFRLAMLPNLPNPFSSSTTVSFSLAESGHAKIRIYDVSGRLVRALLNEELPVGRHETVWDGRDARDRAVSNGVYFLRLESAGRTATRKVLRISE